MEVLFTPDKNLHSGSGVVVSTSSVEFTEQKREESDSSEILTINEVGSSLSS